MRHPRKLAVSALVLAAHAGAQDGVRLTLLNDDEFVQGYARVAGLVYGGISGIDYDQQSKFWYVVSNDTGETSPVRFFAMDIRIDEHGNLILNSDEVQKLNHPDGTVYEPGHHSPGAVRIIPPDPIGDEPYLVWSSEGVLDKGYKAGVFEMCTGATFMDGFTTSPHLGFVKGERGPRHARAIEALALLPNMHVVAGYEQALTQDGPPATPGAGTTHVRLMELDYFSAKQVKEFAYPLAEPDSRFGEGTERGLVELVAVDNDTLLALESISIPSDLRGGKAWTEIYLVELAGASDISGIESLKGLSAGSDFTPVTKTLLGDNESLGGLREIPFRAMTFGPMIDDSRASIVLVSDNGLDQYFPTYFAYVAAEGLRPMRPFVKVDAERPGQFEERHLTTEQGTPERIRITREQRAKKAAEEEAKKAAEEAGGK